MTSVVLSICTPPEVHKNFIRKMRQFSFVLSTICIHQEASKTSEICKRICHGTFNVIVLADAGMVVNAIKQLGQWYAGVRSAKTYHSLFPNRILCGHPAHNGSPWIQLHTFQTGNKFDFPIPLRGDDDYDFTY